MGYHWAFGRSVQHGRRWGGGGDRSLKFTSCLLFPVCPCCGLPQCRRRRDLWPGVNVSRALSYWEQGLTIVSVQASPLLNQLLRCLRSGDPAPPRRGGRPALPPHVSHTPSSVFWRTTSYIGHFINQPLFGQKLLLFFKICSVLIFTGLQDPS